MTMTMEKIDNILNKKKWQPKLDSLEGLPIRPSIKKTRLYIDNEYFEKHYAKFFPHSVTTVYCTLAKFANHEKQICFPAAKTIMELNGITNRSTVFKAFKILELYNIIAIIHRSKGRVPNVYALLDASYWKPINSLNFDTVMRLIRRGRTVSIEQGQQLQNQPLNSGTGETRSHLMESSKEIKAENKKDEEAETVKRENYTLEAQELVETLSPSVRALIKRCFSSEDIASALEEIASSGNALQKLTTTETLAVFARRGIIPVKPLPGIFNYIPRPP